MNDLAIRVEGLGKQYRLGEKVRYRTLRESWRHSARETNSEAVEDIIWALNDVSFEVKRGEVVGVIGRNGAGKSTLLKILSRVTRPTTGYADIYGRVGSLLEVGTGFHPELTGRENIYLNGAILGMSRREVNVRFDEIIAFAEINKFLDTPVKRYSSGMYVRLAFAVAAHLDPEILIVDEVLAVGDAAFQRKCLGKMDAVAKGGRTILFVSHNMGAIKQLCPRSILLASGRIEENGNTVDLVRNYLAQARTPVSDDPVVYFRDDEKKSAQLRRFRLLNDRGVPTHIFECDQSISMELIFHAKNELRGACGYLEITNNEGTVVLASDSVDVGENSLGDLSPGYYKVVISVPPRTLAAGGYSVYLNFADATGNGIDGPLTLCSFELTDISSKRGDRRKGFFSTILPWNVEHLPVNSAEYEIGQA